MQKNAWRSISIVVILVVLFINFNHVAIAENEGIEIVPDKAASLISAEEENELTPRDITFGGPTWCTLKATAKVYYAPYGTGCAETEYTLSAGSGVYVVSRDYDYFYVYWYIGNKEMYGYIAMSALNIPSNYTWTEYDVYKPGKCTATTTVLSYAGTANSYFVIGEIYANEYPLMVLGKHVNQYNSKTYYYVQYHTTSGLVKRGWIDSSLGTVTIKNVTSNVAVNDSTCFFSFLDYSGNNALTWNRTTSNIELQTFTGALNQTFKLERAYTNGEYVGFYKITPAEDEESAISVSGLGYANNLSLFMNYNGTLDKRQEFLFELVENTSTTADDRFLFIITTRSTGCSKAFTYSTVGKKITQTNFNPNSLQENQFFRALKVSAPWGGEYGQYTNSSIAPTSFKVHVKYTNNYTLSDIQTCLNRWNSVYPLSLTAITLGNQLDQNRLATIDNVDLEDGVWGRTCPQKRTGNTVTELTITNYNLNSDWHSTLIKLDMDNMTNSGLTASQKQKVITHEFGHALKLSHTYRVLIWDSSSGYNWDERTQSKTLMDQGSSSPGQPQELDVFRVTQKWDSV